MPSEWAMKKATELWRQMTFLDPSPHAIAILRDALSVNADEEYERGFWDSRGKDYTKIRERIAVSNFERGRKQGRIEGLEEAAGIIDEAPYYRELRGGRETMRISTSIDYASDIRARIAQLKEQTK